MNSPFVGQWLLCATAETVFDVTLDSISFASKFDHIGVSADLSAMDLTSTNGMIVRIFADGQFSQCFSDCPVLDWYDQEGVLDHPVNAFDGWTFCDHDRIYFNTNEKPEWSHKHSDADPKRCRYDDGDTTICDFAELVDGRLLRTLNVMTDDSYVNRVAMLYVRDQKF